MGLGVVNHFAANLASVAKIPKKAVVLGDLSEQLEVDCSAEILDLKNII